MKSIPKQILIMMSLLTIHGQAISTNHPEQKTAPELYMETSEPSRFALIIGVTDYTKYSKVIPAEDDLLLLKEAFLAAKFTSVKTALNPTQTDIWKHLENLNTLSGRTPGAAGVYTVVYFLGHGFTGTDQNEYIIPKDDPLQTESAKLNEDAVSIRSVLEILDSPSIAFRLLVIDACRTHAPAGSPRVHKTTIGKFSPQQETPTKIIYSTGPGLPARAPTISGTATPFALGFKDLLSEKDEWLQDAIYTLDQKIIKITKNHQNPTATGEAPALSLQPGEQILEFFKKRWRIMLETKHPCLISDYLSVPNVNPLSVSFQKWLRDFSETIRNCEPTDSYAGIERTVSVPTRSEFPVLSIESNEQIHVYSQPSRSSTIITTGSLRNELIMDMRTGWATVQLPGDIGHIELKQLYGPHSTEYWFTNADSSVPELSSSEEPTKLTVSFHKNPYESFEVGEVCESDGENQSKLKLTQILDIRASCQDLAILNCEEFLKMSNSIETQPSTLEILSVAREEQDFSASSALDDAYVEAAKIYNKLLPFRESGRTVSVFSKPASWAKGSRDNSLVGKLLIRSESNIEYAQFKQSFCNQYPEGHL